MLRNICYHHIKSTDGLNIVAQTLLDHELSRVYLPSVVVAVVVSSRPDGLEDVAASLCSALVHTVQT